MKKNRFFRGLKNIFTKKKMGHPFIIVIANFFAVILGVILGLYLEGMLYQRQMDKITQDKLKLMCLESSTNVDIGLAKYKNYSKENSLDINIYKVEDYALKEALKDNNLYNILKPHEVSLLFGYEKIINTVNEANEKYIDFVHNTNYTITQNGEGVRKKLKNNTASLLAYLYVLQKKVRLYCDETSYLLTEIEANKDLIDTTKENILNGKLDLP